jgi:hypothetical protein
MKIAIADRMIAPNYDLRPVTMDVVRDLCARFHGYESSGDVAVYAFAVFEHDRAVAAYAWQPPPVGAARSACPEAPYGVLALSRMVAIDRANRSLRHVSRPLRRQMRALIDRTRWPVLITYSDEGQGHTGHTYKCSGWYPTVRLPRPFFVDKDGHRASSYANGKHGARDLVRGGTTMLQRWEHRVCPPGQTAIWMTNHGWHRIAIPGKTWASGNQAYTFVKNRP